MDDKVVGKTTRCCASRNSDAENSCNECTICWYVADLHMHMMRCVRQRIKKPIHWSKHEPTVRLFLKLASVVLRSEKRHNESDQKTEPASRKFIKAILYCCRIGNVADKDEVAILVEILRGQIRSHRQLIDGIIDPGKLLRSAYAAFSRSEKQAIDWGRVNSSFSHMATVTIPSHHNRGPANLNRDTTPPMAAFYLMMEAFDEEDKIYCGQEINPGSRYRRYREPNPYPGVRLLPRCAPVIPDNFDRPELGYGTASGKWYFQRQAFEYYKYLHSMRLAVNQFGNVSRQEARVRPIMTEEEVECLMCDQPLPPRRNVESYSNFVEPFWYLHEETIPVTTPARGRGRVTGRGENRPPSTTGASCFEPAAGARGVAHNMRHSQSPGIRGGRHSVRGRIIRH